ncbi:GtrA family protein [Corynebacterium ciconiae]|uniref:GtrA family protein n=1 Tax=Corynebacterium ciconiae TaxID=227319 RepID=UPI000476EB35|nr:GtrA family protein [Corynebacterium ciconiae]
MPSVEGLEAGALAPSGTSLQVQAVKFIVSGGLSAVVDLGLTYLLHIVFGVDKNLGRLVGFIFGTLTAYMINRRWTFQAEPSAKRFTAVAILYTITAVVNLGFFAVGYSIFFDWGWGERLSTVAAFVIAQGTATVINFIVQRLWIFKVS